MDEQIVWKKKEKTMSRETDRLFDELDSAFADEIERLNDDLGAAEATIDGLENHIVEVEAELEAKGNS